MYTPSKEPKKKACTGFTCGVDEAKQVDKTWVKLNKYNKWHNKIYCSQNYTIYTNYINIKIDTKTF